MKHRSKLSQEQHAQQSAAQQTRPEGAQEFAGAEELLRFDAAQTAVPPQIAERLQQSTSAAAPPPARPWWKKWLGQ